MIYSISIKPGSYKTRVLFITDNLMWFNVLWFHFYIVRDIFTFQKYFDLFCRKTSNYILKILICKSQIYFAFDFRKLRIILNIGKIKILMGETDKKKESKDDKKVEKKDGGGDKGWVKKFWCRIAPDHHLVINFWRFFNRVIQ